MGLLMQGGAAVNSQGKIRTIAAYHLKQISFLIVIILTIFINDL